MSADDTLMNDRAFIILFHFILFYFLNSGYTALDISVDKGPSAKARL